MSSDTYNVTVLRVEGTTAELRIRTGTAGGVNDYACTRSFALILFHDGPRDTEQDELRRMDTPLMAAIKGLGESRWYNEQGFMEKHVGDFIAKTEILERNNVREENEETFTLLNETMASAREAGLEPKALEDRLSEVFHHIVLRIEVTDPKWLEGVAPGLVFGSTGWDVWWNDPLRPEPV